MNPNILNPQFSGIHWYTIYTHTHTHIYIYICIQCTACKVVWMVHLKATLRTQDSGCGHLLISALIPRLSYAAESSYNELWTVHLKAFCLLLVIRRGPLLIHRLSYAAEKVAVAERGDRRWCSLHTSHAFFVIDSQPRVYCNACWTAAWRSARRTEPHRPNWGRNSYQEP